MHIERIVHKKLFSLIDFDDIYVIRSILIDYYVFEFYLHWFQFYYYPIFQKLYFMSTWVKHFFYKRWHLLFLSKKWILSLILPIQTFQMYNCLFKPLIEMKEFKNKVLKKGVIWTWYNEKEKEGWILNMRSEMNLNIFTSFLLWYFICSKWLLDMFD